MTPSTHPLAPPHLPPFITPAGETDVLFVITSMTVLLIVVGIGVLYFKLHALPEHLAHGGQKVQMQLVAVLTLISLFTHNHAFWIAGLLIALVPLPDIATPLGSVVRSLERIAAAARPPPEPAPAPPAGDTMAADDGPAAPPGERPGA